MLLKQSSCVTSQEYLCVDTERTDHQRHRETEGTSMQYATEAGDTVLKKHIEEGQDNAQNTRKSIHNESIQVFADVIRSDIIDEIAETKFFSILSDEVTDNANLDKCILPCRVSAIVAASSPSWLVPLSESQPQGIPNTTGLSSLPRIHTILRKTLGLSRSFCVTWTQTTSHSLPSTSACAVVSLSAVPHENFLRIGRKPSPSSSVTIAAVTSGFIASFAVVVCLNLRPSPTCDAMVLRGISLVNPKYCWNFSPSKLFHQNSRDNSRTKHALHLMRWDSLHDPYQNKRYFPNQPPRAAASRGSPHPVGDPQIASRKLRLALCFQQR
ncbi:hypothetical protein LSAT2_010654 [Lamellibrachia satsuma]|nr:hypothetical protein LSAT2_010654 [Lamellibrachia satsuma]